MKNNRISNLAEFRRWVKIRLVEKEISQNELARQMGIPHARISEATHGKQSGNKYIIPIIEELDGDVDDFKELQKKYKCYSKSVYSSYSIEQIRKAASDASCVVVTGVVAECCVLSTVMSLIDAGVYVIYLKDAVAGVNNETEEATIKVLEGLAPLHLSIMTTEEYLQIKLN